MDKDDRNCLELQVDRSNDQGEGGHWTPQHVLQHHCHLVGQCQEGESTSRSTPKFPRPHLPVHSLLNSCMDCVVAQMGFNSENRLFSSSLVYLPISSFLSPGLLCDTQSVVRNSNNDSGCYSEVECITFIMRKLDNKVQNHSFDRWLPWVALPRWLSQLSA